MLAKKTILRSQVAAIALCFCSSLSAEITLQVPRAAIERGQPFQITFEITGAAAAQPDLSPLAEEFQILNRSSRQQTSVRNGVRSQRATLTLTLLPKRSGNLQIPSLAFGNEYSQAQMISVLGGTDDDDQASGPTGDWPGAQYPGDPFGSQNPWESFGMQAPPYAVPQAAPLYPGPDPSGGAYDQPYGGSTQTLVPREPWVTLTPQPGEPARSSTEWSIQSTPSAPPARGYPVGEPDNGAEEASALPARGCPLWLVVLLVSGWLATLTFCWLRSRKQQAPSAQPGHPPPPRAAQPKPKPMSAEEKALLAVRRAYEQADPSAARQALLAWAGLIWPGDAPSNLTKLADRVGDAAHNSILKLDEALYSPTPVQWNDAAVWEQLGHRSPQPGATQQR